MNFNSPHKNKTVLGNKLYRWKKKLKYVAMFLYIKARTEFLLFFHF